MINEQTAMSVIFSFSPEAGRKHSVLVIYDMPLELLT